MTENTAPLSEDDRQLLRTLVNGERFAIGFQYLLICCFSAVFVVGLMVFISEPDIALFFLLLIGIGAGVVAFLLVRDLYKRRNNGIKPLQHAIRHGGTKTILEGQLTQVSPQGKAQLCYRIDGIDQVVSPLLAYRGIALFPQPVRDIRTLTTCPVSLHLWAFPDNSKVLLKAVYPQPPAGTPTFKATISEKTNSGAVFVYLALTILYVSLMAAILSGIFRFGGVFLGVLPLTCLYIIAMRKVYKRAKGKRTTQMQRITGRVTEMMNVRTRTEVMGQPTSNPYDHWFRIDGKGYCMICNQPLDGIALGDTIELTIVGKPLHNETGE